jgi:Histidine kinase/Histidine kinase-, DNA gyrase B-, and HSP90-like ATPase
MSHGPGVRLGEPLPGEVLRRVSGGLAAYRNYPVFSWPWLARRTLLFGLFLASFAALMGIGMYVSKQNLGLAVSNSVYFVAGIMLIATPGPLLATLVRHRRLRVAWERRLVVAALVFGLLTSFLFDDWASSALKQGLGNDQPLARLGQTPEQPAAPPAAVTVVNVLVLVVIYGLLGGGLAVRRYLDEPRRFAELARERELAALRAHKHAMEMKLGALQAQVEPHFLFNTLASVRSLIGRDARAAESAIDALVDYLRATIPRFREQASGVDSTLGQQLEICENYLELMKVRMGGRLERAVEVDAGLREVAFPALLLISLVENAIKHGLEPKPGPGRILIRAVRDRAGAEERLAVSVIDDGTGLRDGTGSGVGLSNVREQLRARYGDRAQLTLTGAAGAGTTARIVVPLEARPA